jgi:ABC-type transport system involved in cytochrome bd biosynthesis fused ATPase/permease subunit
MLTVDMFLYAFLGYYFDQIIQSDYGISRPWYFLCTSEFWGGKRAKVEAGEGSQLLLDADEEVPLNEDPNTFERVPDSLKRMEKTGDCLKIRKLRKEFGTKVAVNDVDMTMYNGQIFALLGHNGAGKTTTISMLTGLLQANSGRAAVKDIDILNQMDEFRKSLGVCPQHDVLFEYLTVKEHLELFAAFKGDQSD